MYMYIFFSSLSELVIVMVLDLSKPNDIWEIQHAILSQVCKILFKLLCFLRTLILQINNRKNTALQLFPVLQFPI